MVQIWSEPTRIRIVDGAHPAPRGVHLGETPSFPARSLGFFASVEESKHAKAAATFSRPAGTCVHFRAYDSAPLEGDA